MVTESDRREELLRETDAKETRTARVRDRLGLRSDPRAAEEVTEWATGAGAVVFALAAGAVVIFLLVRVATALISAI